MQADWADMMAQLGRFEPTVGIGAVTAVSSVWLEADGPDAPVGALCAVEHDEGETLARLVALSPGRTVLAPLDSVGCIRIGDVVRLVRTIMEAPSGEAFAGRAIDALGGPLDGGGPIAGEARPHRPPSPLERVTSREFAATGIRAIDGLLPLSRGQRIGVMAAPGVGKTTLLAQMARQIDADRCVICLVGERGREVEALWSSGIDDAVRTRSVLVAATSEETAARRVQAVEQALALATRWRDEGLHVLFLLDSVTRYAMALRELGLAAGEPPTVRAYTPGVFAALPRLVERCGAVKGGGAITAVMTVLSESDDVDDPVVEVMKSLTDGHILLSRRIAERGRYPAIDVLRSISRLARNVMTEDHARASARILSILSAYEAARPMIDAGVYAPGGNAETDEAVQRRPAIEAFLAQADDEASDWSRTLDALRQVAGTA